MHTVLGNQSEIEDDCMIGACSMVKDTLKFLQNLSRRGSGQNRKSARHRELERILDGSRTYSELAREFKNPDYEVKVNRHGVVGTHVLY